jgi:hypothetical protein
MDQYNYRQHDNDSDNDSLFSDELQTSLQDSPSTLTDNLTNSYSEEDTLDYTETQTDPSSINGSDSDSIASSCMNIDPYTLSDFTDEPDLVIIKVLNSSNKFDKGECITREMLIQILESHENDALNYDNDNPTEYTPQNIMTIWSSPKDLNKAGYGGKPTSKWVFKLPNLMFITIGSLKRILQNKNVNTWYALPLYNGKARRIGNIYGIIGVSMNHGQLPGFKIYKLFTKEEVKSGIVAKETLDDYGLIIPPNGNKKNPYLNDNIIPIIMHGLNNLYDDKIDEYREW